MKTLKIYTRRWRVLGERSTSEKIVLLAEAVAGLGREAGPFLEVVGRQAVRRRDLAVLKAITQQYVLLCRDVDLSAVMCDAGEAGWEAGFQVLVGAGCLCALDGYWTAYRVHASALYIPEFGGAEGDVEEEEQAFRDFLAVIEPWEDAMTAIGYVLKHYVGASISGTRIAEMVAAEIATRRELRRLPPVFGDPEGEFLR